MFTADGWPEVFQLITMEWVLSIARASAMLVIGFVLAKVVSGALGRLFRDTANPHQSMLIRRGSFYLILCLFLISAMVELGFSLGVLVGTAGILTVAIGFASQTSMSNLISGLFLIGERPFAIGDVIKMGEITGEVLAIDLLSIKLRTFENTYVRIPNESIIKTPVTTLTRFPIRRIDLPLKVAYKEDLANVKQVLFDVADKNVLCLDEPQPLLIVQGFGDSGVNLQFSVWVRREQFLDLKNAIQMEIKLAFESAHIEIPFPHYALSTGTVTEPFPVKMVTEPTSD